MNSGKPYQPQGFWDWPDDEVASHNLGALAEAIVKAGADADATRIRVPSNTLDWAPEFRTELVNRVRSKALAPLPQRKRILLRLLSAEETDAAYCGSPPAVDVQ